MVHGMPTLFQAVDHKRGDLLVILYHQDPHGRKHRVEGRGTLIKSEIRRSKWGPFPRKHSSFVSVFDLRPSDFFQVLALGFRISFGFRPFGIRISKEGPSPPERTGREGLVATEKFSR